MIGHTSNVCCVDGLVGGDGLGEWNSPQRSLSQRDGEPEADLPSLLLLLQSPALGIRSSSSRLHMFLSNAQLTIISLHAAPPSSGPPPSNKSKSSKPTPKQSGPFDPSPRPNSSPVPPTKPSFSGLKAFHLPIPGRRLLASSATPTPSDASLPSQEERPSPPPPTTAPSSSLLSRPETLSSPFTVTPLSFTRWLSCRRGRSWSVLVRIGR